MRLYAATAHLLEPSPFWVEAEAPLDQKETTLYLRLPRELPPGLYVLRVNVYKGEERQPIRTSQGRGVDLLALKPIQVMEAQQANGQERVLGTFGPERVPPVIALVGVQAKPKDSCLEVTLHWRSERQAPLNYMLSLRLRAPDGQLLASRDLPPLLGIYPTSLWRPGELLSDRVLLPLPKGVVPTPQDCLEIILYDRLSLKAAGTAHVPLNQAWFKGD